MGRSVRRRRISVRALLPIASMIVSTRWGIWGGLDTFGTAALCRTGGHADPLGKWTFNVHSCVMVRVEQDAHKRELRELLRVAILTRPLRMFETGKGAAAMLLNLIERGADFALPAAHRTGLPTNRQPAATFRNGLGANSSVAVRSHAPSVAFTGREPPQRNDDSVNPTPTAAPITSAERSLPDFLFAGRCGTHSLELHLRQTTERPTSHRRAPQTTSLSSNHIADSGGAL